MIKRWFKNRLITIMEHNYYQPWWLTEEECSKNDKWTPCDLIAREYLNNGGGSSKGFLGITRAECIKCYDYMCEPEVKAELISLGYISEKAWNNSGYPLWYDYNYDR